ncbi:MAG: tetratricopeptide repeat protein [Cyanobacteria bacterium]|nr:tetratricopeptide repeat protein [Cyanobacteriota bacterium]
MMLINAHENALANAASETKAKEIAQASWNTLSKELSVYLNFLGVYFSERKKYLEAIQYYDRAIKINPSYAMAYFSRGGTKADLRLYNEASQDLQIAEQLFHEQGDLTNYQNARKILMQIESLNSSSAQEEILNNAKPRAMTLEQAMDIAEAQIYSLNNPYLSAEEKLEVAMWYSLPGNLMIYAFFATAIYSTIHPLNWFYLLGIPLAVNLVSGLINWFVYSKALMNILYMIILHGLIMLILIIAGIVFLASKGAYILAIIVLLSFFGLLTPFELHIILYADLSKKYNMNPQYAFFKRFYNFRFPFEEVR